MWRAATPERRDAVRMYWEWFDAAPWLYEEENMWSYFERRFGEASAAELRALHQDNYIRESDFERIAGIAVEKASIMDGLSPGGTAILPEGLTITTNPPSLNGPDRTYPITILDDPARRGPPGARSPAAASYRTG